MTFWLPVILFVAAAGALFVIPVIRQIHQDTRMTRDGLNQAFYQYRLTELKQDEDQGVIVASQEMIQELQQNLLDDISQTKKAHALPCSRWTLLPGILILMLVPLILYVKTGALTQVQAWQQLMTQMPQWRARIANPHAVPLNLEEMAQFGLGLRTLLQFDGDNINDWMMLGRVAMILNNISTAIQAFSQAYQRAPTNPQVTLGYAEVLIHSNDLQDRQTATQILGKVIAQDQNNLRALGLLAFNAFEQNDLAQAISHWERMLKLLPGDDPRAKLVRLSIERASAQANSKPSDNR